MHFVQPDTLIPDLYNPQSLNRYAYVNNNPIRYNDPTGHAQCDLTNDRICGSLETTGDSLNDLKALINYRFDWKVKGKDWTLKELATIYQTGKDILNHVDDLTGGLGQEWMLAYLGNTTIQHGNSNQALPSWLTLTGVNTISLKQGQFNANWFAHEPGHVWDINSGNFLGIGGGVGDDLMWAVWGDPRKSFRVFRYEKNGDPAIPLGEARWRQGVNGGYGNGSVNDYAAEAFSWSIYNPDNLPFGSDGVVALVVNQTIIQQANAIP